MNTELGEKVVLHLYDLSGGMMKQMSASLLGKEFEGFWHTGIIVFGREYFYGGGIQKELPGHTIAGNPFRVIELGTTFIPQDVFEQYLEQIAPNYSFEKYSLMNHNCNNFTDEIAQFLLGNGIPKYIIQLPQEVLSTPLGQLIRPFLEQWEASMLSGSVGAPVNPLFGQSQTQSHPHYFA